MKLLRWLLILSLLGGNALALARERHTTSAVRTTAHYQLPSLTLVRADGVKVNFPKEIDDGKPVILNFIYTSCSAICPVMSRTFATVQARLGIEQQKVHLVSISIDPEQDTPAQLRAYAASYRAGPIWQFYSGTPQTSVALQRAFDAYRGDKMSHAPLTFLRRAPGEPWVRLEGFATPDQILREYRLWVATK